MVATKYQSFVQPDLCAKRTKRPFQEMLCLAPVPEARKYTKTEKTCAEPWCTQAMNGAALPEFGTEYDSAPFSKVSCTLFCSVGLGRISNP